MGTARVVMTTENESDQISQKNACEGHGERPAPKRPAFLFAQSTETEDAIARYERKRSEKRGW
ncbi:hypothetical protein [Aurantimonas coralicida]|uniref:hypothetical protein n=1 Tax=Aurantimonas coralicida TaxID=182270 RepID=UPI00238C378F|nr:hypothetical protein [Aurantimonas coralicida]MDE0925397.1 hypothetical protein [Aurantimonas coralicida]